MNKKIKYLLLSNAIFVLAGSILLPVYALFVQSINGGIELAGILFGLGFLSSSFTSLIVTRIHDGVRFENTMMKLCFFVRALAWLAIAFFPNLSVLLVAQIIIGITDGFGAPVFNELFSRYLDNKKHIKEWGIWQFLVGIAVATGSGLSGFIIASFGFPILFIIMSSLAFVALFIYKLGEK